MSKENEPIQVFTLSTGNQLNSNAADKPEDTFTLGPIEVVCSKYYPGHNFHWIPIFNHSHPRKVVKVTHLEGNAFLVTRNGRTSIWYHHDPERLKQAITLAKKEDIKATVGRTWLFIGHGSGSYAFNCHDEEPGPCHFKH